MPNQEFIPRLWHCPDQSMKGASLETLIFHELRVYNEISRKLRPLAYYRTAAGVEIDFIVETRKRQAGKAPHLVAIEAKLAEKCNRTWEAPMRGLNSLPGIKVERMFGVYTGPRVYHFEGVVVLPAPDFLRTLHRGEVF